MVRVRAVRVRAFRVGAFRDMVTVWKRARIRAIFIGPFIELGPFF